MNPPPEDFETINARAWGEDTAISEPISEHAQLSSDISSTLDTPNTRSSTAQGFQNRIPRSTSLPNVASPREPPRTPVSRRGGQQYKGSRRTPDSQGFRRPLQPPSQYNSPSAYASNRYSQENAAKIPDFSITNSRKTPQATPSQESFQSSRQGSERTLVVNSKWAEAKRLVTTRRANDYEDRKAKAADRESFLKAANDNENYPVIGFYMWPSKSEQPTELLGLRLEKVDPIRLEYRVHIEEMIGEQCLKISCPKFHSQPEHWLMKTVDGIRSAVRDAKSTVIAAEPVYIVVPPSPSSIRTVVRPSVVESVLIERLGVQQRRKLWKASDLELAGANLSEAELLAWKTTERKTLMESNLTRFEKHLVENLIALASNKGLMQMRVHFGRATLMKSTKAFKDGKMGFEDFAIMMAARGMETKFDREIGNAVIVLRLRDMIIQSPGRFRPVQASLWTLEDVEFKDTAVIIVKKKDGGQFRIEADVDRVLESGVSQYQLGAIKHFYDNRTNMRMQIETLDVERKIDYTLEVVSDNAVHEISSKLLSVTTDLVSACSVARQDALGLDFPNVNPKFVPDLDLVSVTIHSTAQYMLKKSSYIVEIAIDRQWPSMNTSPEPKIIASVSMHHQQWDWEMRSFEDSPNQRTWSRDLNEFFDDSEGGMSRIAKFLSEVEIVQSFLAAATHPEVCQTSSDEDQPDIYSADV